MSRAPRRHFQSPHLDGRQTAPYPFVISPKGVTTASSIFFDPILTGLTHCVVELVLRPFRRTVSTIDAALLREAGRLAPENL